MIRKRSYIPATINLIRWYGRYPQFEILRTEKHRLELKLLAYCMKSGKS